MKNILFISPTGTLDNGAEQSITSLMGHLAESGYHIINVVPSENHSTTENYQKKMESNNIELIPLEYNNWWWEDAPGIKKDSLQDRTLFYQKYVYELRQLIQEKSVDIVISNTANVFQGAIAAAIEQKTHYWLIHEFPLEEFSYYKKLIPLMESLSDKIFAVSGELESHLQNLFENSEKLSSFVPFGAFQSNLKDNVNDDIRLVSIGRINDNKNQLEILKAYLHLSCPRPNLVFIGDYDETYKNKCDQFISENQLTGITFIPNKSNPWDYVTGSDIILLTSKMETFGLVYAEALLNGVPTIAANNPGYKSVTNYFGFGQLYELGNVQDLVNKIQSYLANYNDFKSSVLNQVNKIQDLYTMETAYSNILEVLNGDGGYKEKSYFPLLSNFIGAYDPQEIFSPANKENVKIYYRSDSENWDERRCISYLLINKDKISFSLPDNTFEVRIDMSERPSYYKEIRLKNIEDNTQLLPKTISGINVGESYYFNHVDPQMIFNISYLKSKNFELSYLVSNLSHLYQDDFLPDFLSSQLNNVLKKQKEYDYLEILNNQLYERNKEIQTQLEEMVVRYNSVTHSRRWTIPTKIINFLRRNK
ncbi:UDP-D-galactose:(glucosyl)lipopolysaccharide-1,6-D-galactosyltransferase [Streptococcus parauberis]|uniref:glycosyltransferase n=1 Tax=Streptococcus parauberis TaxID=1348 RepID=UPI000CCFB633|nr:glycosyltransferase [Streptococcus parauberis]PNY21552.1 UDP-D-galactose:(glucosyl)lipopolysaccharide-1,6-D-galactosyltransferase [Streptococcus parauberis]